MQTILEQGIIDWFFDEYVDAKFGVILSLRSYLMRKRLLASSSSAEAKLRSPVIREDEMVFSLVWLSRNVIIS